MGDNSVDEDPWFDSRWPTPSPDARRRNLEAVEDARKVLADAASRFRAARTERRNNGDREGV